MPTEPLVWALKRLQVQLRGLPERHRRIRLGHRGSQDCVRRVKDHGPDRTQEPPPSRTSSRMMLRRSRRTWRRIRADASVSLPGVPQIVTRLQQLLSDPDVSIPQIVPVINYEPILVGRVLQMAQLRGAQSDAPHGHGPARPAVTRVGFTLLRSASLAYALRQVSQAHSVKDIRPHLEALWERSAWTAAVSYVIARKFTQREPRSRVPRRPHARRRQAVHPHARGALPVRAARPDQVRRHPAQVARAVRASGILTGWKRQSTKSSKPLRSTRTSIARWSATSRTSPTSSPPAISSSATPAACRICR